MTSPAASLRGGAVGVLTVALAIAAHGGAGGGYPSVSASMFLFAVAVGIGALASAPRPGRATLVGALMLGQLAAHVALSISGPHDMAHDHALLPGPTMMLFHLGASTVAAVLIAAAERLYGPITSIVRAVLYPPLPLPDAIPGSWVFPQAPRVPLTRSFTTSISRRGPPIPTR